MMKLIQDDDLRDEKCAYRMVSKDLENGVGRSFHNDKIQDQLDESSEFVDSENIEENVNPNADQSELAPDIIQEDSNDFIKRSKSLRGQKRKKTFDSNDLSNSRQITEDKGGDSPIRRIDSQHSAMQSVNDFKNALVKQKSKVKKAIL